jgi:hypothetical protein
MLTILPREDEVVITGSEGKIREVILRYIIRPGHYREEKQET